jgi:catechol 2,3-dioxygenase-like lactoylglutathione lyase family enzyme
MAMSLRFQRANFVVRDLDRALTLYRDVLGFEVAFTQGHNPDSYSFPVFEIPAEAQLRFCVLSTATQERVMALTEITGVDLPPVHHPRRSAIVLEVADPDQVVAKARSAGAQVYEEGELLTKDGRRGREIGIADFDDNLIVIYKILGAE